MTQDASQTGRGEGLRPHENPEVWAPRLERVLGRQVGLYEELDRLGGQQSELVQAGDADRLIGLLARRQELIDQVTELNRELEPFTSQWETLVERLPSRHREQIQAQIARLGELVETITRRDKADHEALETRRAALASDMNSLGRSRAAVAAYGAKAPKAPSPRYQDTEG